MNSRQKAIEELKKQIELGKERLGPEGVKELQRMAKGIQAPSSVSTNIPEDSVPYDKETALKALELYLQNHGDPERLRKQILEMVNKSNS